MKGSLPPEVDFLVREGVHGVEFATGVVSEQTGTSIEADPAEGPQRAEVLRSGHNPALQPKEGDTALLAQMGEIWYVVAILDGEEPPIARVGEAGGIEIVNSNGSRIGIHDGGIKIYED